MLKQLSNDYSVHSLQITNFKNFRNQLLKLRKNRDFPG